MQAEGGYFDVIQLLRRSLGKAGVAGDGKADFHVALHAYDNVPVLIGCVS